MILPFGYSGILDRLHTVPQESLEKLSLMFAEDVLVGALDYIDRDCGQSKFRRLVRAFV